MSNTGGRAEYYAASPQPDRPRSWIWPALFGVGTVIAGVLIVFVVLQLTNDDGAAVTDASSTVATSPAAVSPTAPVPAETSAPADTPTGTTATAGSDPSEQGDGDAGPVDRNCSSYATDESLPVQLCAKGALVEEIQFGLQVAGFDVQVDGLFGPNTEIAVLEFQTSQGLEQDGIVGPATFDALPPVLIEPD